MRYLKSLKNKNLYGKIFLVREGLNIKSAKDPFKLEHSLPTVRFLLSKKARVVILGHKGRPKLKDKGSRDFSLRIFIPFLEKKLRQRVVFLKTIPRKLPSGNLFLLENLRFFPGEKKNDHGFAKRLAALGDFYVNNAFANGHRRHASMVAITKLLPSYAGFLLEEEVKHLSKILTKPKKPLVMVFGGAKLISKTKTIRHLLPRAGAVLLGSGVVNHPNIGIRSPKLVRPVDWISEKGVAFDIGPLTIELFRPYIEKAGTIIWNGPLGRFEDERFAGGSVALAKMIAKSRAFSVAGGGETTQLVERLGLEKRYNFLSTGGGAMLAFLAGEKLPGIEALKRK